MPDPTPTPIAANPDAYVPLTVPGASSSVVVAVARCPSSTHGSRRPVAVSHGTYLPGTASAVEVDYCARCALELSLAGLFEPDR